MQFDRSNTVVIDIQCHVDNNREYVIKELTYGYCDGSSPPVHCVFKPPYDLFDLDMDIVLQNDYIFKRIHGLQWMAGDVPYTRLDDVLNLFKTCTILVKGNEKLKCLRKFLPNTTIFDLVSMKKILDYNTPDFVTSCSFHSGGKHDRCSWINLHKILCFLEDENLLF